MTDKRLLEILYNKEGCKMSEDNLSIMEYFVRRDFKEFYKYHQKSYVVNRWNLYCDSEGNYNTVHIVFNISISGVRYSEHIHVPVSDFISEWRERNIDKVLN